MKTKKLCLLPILFLLLNSCGKATYMVYFDFDGYETISVKEGRKISKPEDPYKEPTEQYCYVFNGWQDSNKKWDFNNDVVNNNTILYPIFDEVLRSYMVYFVSDGKILESKEYKYGETPSYNGTTPTKPDNNGITYTFSGWDHQFSKVKGEQTYNAVFSSNEEKFQFIDMEETYYGYDERIKNYLEHPNPDVKNFLTPRIDNQAKPITIKWQISNLNQKSLKCIYSLNNDFSDSTEINLQLSADSVDLYNLYKGTTYYLKIVATLNDDSTKYIQTSFKTTDLGPRFMNIEGIYNTRDLGGYLTSGGKITKQGLLYRGGALSISTDTYYNDKVTLTDDGKAYMKDVLKIKSEFDLRSPAENYNLAESPIPGATLTYFNMGSYTQAFSASESFKNLFKELFKTENYPIYIHCTGGADRTGTICFLANALLGVSEKDLIHDYEVTSFSIYNERNSRQGSEYPFYDFYQQLKRDYLGNTLAEKVNNYLLSIGITQDEINNFKNIML